MARCHGDYHWGSSLPCLAALLSSPGVPCFHDPMLPYVVMWVVTACLVLHVSWSLVTCNIWVRLMAVNHQCIWARTHSLCCVSSNIHKTGHAHMQLCCFSWLQSDALLAYICFLGYGFMLTQNSHHDSWGHDRRVIFCAMCLNATWCFGHRLGAGSRYQQSKLPKQPLELWAYELSPFCKVGFPHPNWYSISACIAKTAMPAIDDSIF